MAIKNIIKILLIILFCLIIFVSISKDKNAKYDLDKKNITKIIVDHSLSTQSEVIYNNLEDALEAAQAYTEIYIKEGTYDINNPLIIDKPGIKLIGMQRDTVSIFPKNAGEAIFVLNADDITIESLEISGIDRNHSTHATFAVFINKDIDNSRIINNKIINTGGTAIIGYNIKRCLIDNNLIINAGDDGIRLRGKSLVIIKNSIYRYFDEAIDLAGGENIIVSYNDCISGRIAITVGSQSAIVSHNFVIDQLEEGIVAITKSKGIFTFNTLKNSGKYGAIVLHNPSYVSHNWIQGNSTTGIHTLGMNGGTIQNNIVLDTKAGLKVTKSEGSIIKLNIFSNNINQMIETTNSKNNYIEKNSKCSLGKNSDDRKDIHCTISNETDSFRRRHYWNLQKLFKLKAIFGQHTQNNLEIEKEHKLNANEIKGNSKHSRKIANKVAALLYHKNPGIKSIYVTQNIMESEITEDLYKILVGGTPYTRGLVRYPFLIFKKETKSKYVQWKLKYSGKDVLIICPSKKKTDAGLKLIFLNDGELSIKDKFIIFIDKIYHNII
jgi:parallel beta-helix repeat protein